jgi:hypothetical protein
MAYRLIPGAAAHRSWIRRAHAAGSRYTISRMSLGPDTRSSGQKPQWVTWSLAVGSVLAVVATSPPPPCPIEVIAKDELWVLPETPVFEHRYELGGAAGQATASVSARTAEGEAVSLAIRVIPEGSADGTLDGGASEATLTLSGLGAGSFEAQFLPSVFSLRVELLGGSGALVAVQVTAYGNACGADWHQSVERN